MKIIYRKPEISDRRRLGIIAGAVFKGQIDTPELIESADLDNSLVALVNEKIVGMNLIGNRSLTQGLRDYRRRKINLLEDLSRYGEKIGVECLLLAILSPYCKNGMGNYLIDHSSGLGADYLWCLSGKSFNAGNFWLKRSRLVAETSTDYVFLQDFH